MVTVLCRKSLDLRELHVIPFRSYWYIWASGLFLLLVFKNVIVFVPIGLLLGCAFGRMKWWKALAIGEGFPILIKVLKFVFKRGFAEFDDVLLLECKDVPWESLGEAYILKFDNYKIS